MRPLPALICLLLCACGSPNPGPGPSPAERDPQDRAPGEVEPASSEAEVGSAGTGRQDPPTSAPAGGAGDAAADPTGGQAPPEDLDPPGAAAPPTAAETDSETDIESDTESEGAPGTPPGTAPETPTVAATDPPVDATPPPPVREDPPTPDRVPPARDDPARADPAEDGPLDLGSLLDSVLTGPETPPWIHADLDRLLRTHVRDERVDYLLLRRDDWATLQGYLDRMAKVELRDLSRNQRLAYWINLYNASMLRMIGERLRAGYSPADDEYGVFEEKTIETVAGRYSLNQLENEIVRPRFEEPRIHVALVCGARSCPPLIPEAYRAEGLDERLDANMRAFVQDPFRNRVDPAAGRLRLSHLFDWYAGDFGGPDAVAAYVDRYHPADLDGAEVEGFLDYSWELNLAPPREGRWIALAEDADLSASPGGPRQARGEAGAPFEVLEEKAGWLRLARFDGEAPVWVESGRTRAW